MIVTAIERAHRRGRMNIYIDGVVAFEIARTALGEHKLRPGREIDEDEIGAIVAAVARREALASALAMLTRRPRSEREIRRRLAQRKCDATLIDETIARLRTAKLLDDAEFARMWTESRDRLSPRGQRLMVQELRALGVANEIATDAASTVDDPEAAYRVASKRKRSLSRFAYPEFRTKLGAYLQRRGFGWDIARATVDRCWRELDRDITDDDE